MTNQELFKEHTKGEKRVFQQWARDNYKPFDPIPPVWHPTTQAECRKINGEIKDAIEKQWGENFLDAAVKAVTEGVK
tara:strand:+ start:5323 stop:5553 length:231 start_codon:yes stop_codon:yes gene_type:complete